LSTSPALLWYFVDVRVLSHAALPRNMSQCLLFGRLQRRRFHHGECWTPLPVFGLLGMAFAARRRPRRMSSALAHVPHQPRDGLVQSPLALAGYTRHHSSFAFGGKLHEPLQLHQQLTLVPLGLSRSRDFQTNPRLGSFLKSIRTVSDAGIS